jgi:hypothetical protein
MESFPSWEIQLPKDYDVMSVELVTPSTLAMINVEVWVRDAEIGVPPSNIEGHRANGTFGTLCASTTVINPSEVRPLHCPRPLRGNAITVITVTDSAQVSYPKFGQIALCEFRIKAVVPVAPIFRALCKETCANLKPWVPDDTVPPPPDESDYKGSAVRRLSGRRLKKKEAEIAVLPRNPDDWETKFRSFFPTAADSADAPGVDGVGAYCADSASSLADVRKLGSWFPALCPAKGTLDPVCRTVPLCPAQTVCVLTETRFLDELAMRRGDIPLASPIAKAAPFLRETYLGSKPQVLVTGTRLDALVDHRQLLPEVTPLSVLARAAPGATAVRLTPSDGAFTVLTVVSALESKGVEALGHLGCQYHQHARLTPWKTDVLRVEVFDENFKPAKVAREVQVHAPGVETLIIVKYSHGSCGPEVVLGPAEPLGDGWFSFMAMSGADYIGADDMRECEMDYCDKNAKCEERLAEVPKCSCIPPWGGNGLTCALESGYYDGLSLSLKTTYPGLGARWDTRVERIAGKATYTSTATGMYLTYSAEHSAWIIGPKEGEFFPAVLMAVTDVFDPSDIPGPWKAFNETLVHEADLVGTAEEVEAATGMFPGIESMVENVTTSFGFTLLYAYRANVTGTWVPIPDRLAFSRGFSYGWQQFVISPAAPVEFGWRVSEVELFRDPECNSKLDTSYIANVEVSGLFPVPDWPKRGLPDAEFLMDGDKSTSWWTLQFANAGTGVPKHDKDLQSHTGASWISFFVEAGVECVRVTQVKGHAASKLRLQRKTSPTAECGEGCVKAGLYLAYAPMHPDSSSYATADVWKKPMGVDVRITCGVEDFQLFGELLFGGEESEGYKPQTADAGAFRVPRGMFRNVPTPCSCQQLCIEHMESGCASWKWYRETQHCILQKPFDQSSAQTWSAAARNPSVCTGPSCGRGWHDSLGLTYAGWTSGMTGLIVRGAEIAAPDSNGERKLTVRGLSLGVDGIKSRANEQRAKLVDGTDCRAPVAEGVYGIACTSPQLCAPAPMETTAFEASWGVRIRDSSRPRKLGVCYCTFDCDEYLMWQLADELEIAASPYVWSLSPEVKVTRALPEFTLTVSRVAMSSFEDPAGWSILLIAHRATTQPSPNGGCRAA